MKKVVEGSMAVAIAAKICKPAVIPMYPITPQTA
jgi:pyruvate/2-oxoacid:ferredoxin oxidoreductase alpha subunit